MNPALEKVLSAMNKMMGEKEGGLKRLTSNLGHEATRQKRVRRKYALTNKQRSLVERKEKKRRKMADQSRKINRLRGVGK